MERYARQTNVAAAVIISVVWVLLAPGYRFTPNLQRLRLSVSGKHNTGCRAGFS